MQKIQADDLVNMSEFLGACPLRIEVAYARADNLLFGERIYRADAALWLHKMLADIVVGAARALRGSDMRLVLYDGLRTTCAQAKMLETQRVRDNPHWLEPPRLLSPPGRGAHPRGMAIDVSLETRDGGLLDMGTAFDYLSADPSKAGNPAHREYACSKDVAVNRARLDDLMFGAAEKCGATLMGLPQEWWDFRLPPEIYDHYAPLSDDDLPAEMKMCD